MCFRRLTAVYCQGGGCAIGICGGRCYSAWRWVSSYPAKRPIPPRHAAAIVPGATEASYAFADIFVTVWVGSGVVTLNAVLLRGKVSFFQTVCVLGYCIFPLVLSAFCAMLLRVDWLKALGVPKCP